jgi:uncharacterized protein involved in exopolysaccharide biosynthesis
MSETSVLTPEAMATSAPTVLTPPYIALLELLWLHRSLLIKSAAAGLILATALAFATPKEYTSTAQLEAPSAQIESSSLAALASATVPSALTGVASSILGKTDTGYIAIGILRSRTVQDDLINQFDLRRVYHIRLYVDTRKRLVRKTSIEQDQKSGNIVISVMDRDPKRAQDMVTVYIAELNKLTSSLSTSSARRERIFLEERLKAIKSDLDKSAQNLSQFSSRNTTLDMQDEGKMLLAYSEKLQEALSTEQSTLRGLETTYGQNNVRVQAEQAQVRELEGQLKRLTGNQNESSAPLGEDQLYPSVRKLPMLGATYADLSRRATVQEAVFEMLTTQYEIAKVEEAKEIPTISVLDPPSFPEQKSYPPRRMMVIEGFIAGWLFAAVWVCARRSWEKMSADDPRKRFVYHIGASLKRSRRA